MPDHEPFDGTVPFVTKMSIYAAPYRWFVGHPTGRTMSRRFPTWREAMNYATKEDHR